MRWLFDGVQTKTTDYDAIPVHSSPPPTQIFVPLKLLCCFMAGGGNEYFCSSPPLLILVAIIQPDAKSDPAEDFLEIHGTLEEM